MVRSNKILGSGGFHHVAMKVKDFDATIRFYTEVLGFTKAISWGEETKRGVMLDAGDGACLEIFESLDEMPRPEGAFCHLALRTSKCDEVLERVRAAGMQVTIEAKDILLNSDPPTPARIAFFKGLNGEVIELFQNK